MLPGVEVMDLNTEELKQFGNEWGAAPVWSPDGAYLVVPELMLADEALVVRLVRIDLGAGELLDISGDENLVKDVGPAWSPGGGWIVFGRQYLDEERWTPQLIIDTRVREALIQSVGHETASKLVVPLPTIKFTDEDLIPYMYCTKPSSAERDEGLESMYLVTNRKAGKGLVNADGKDKWDTKTKNPHPTPKPIALAEWVLRLFMIPNKEEMVVLDTFSGQGTHLRACKKLGIPFIGVELNEEFCKITDLKFQHMDKQEEQITMFGG